MSLNVKDVTPEREKPRPQSRRTQTRNALRNRRAWRISRLKRLGIMGLFLIIVFGMGIWLSVFSNMELIKFEMTATVMDKEGNPIPDAIVYAIKGDNISWKATTNSEGKARLYLSPTSRYTIMVMKDGKAGAVSQMIYAPSDFTVKILELK